MANLTMLVDPAEEETEMSYVAAYALLLDNRIQSQISSRKDELEQGLSQGFHEAASIALQQATAVREKKCKTDAGKGRRKVTIEVVEDEDDLRA